LGNSAKTEKSRQSLGCLDTAEAMVSLVVNCELWRFPYKLWRKYCAKTT